MLVLATTVVFLLFIYAAACSTTDAPTLPAETHSPWVMPGAQQTAAVLASLSDARTRVVPTLGDRSSATRLDASLSAIETAFTAGRPDDVARETTTARAVIAGYSASARADDAVALSVIDLVLDRATQLIGMPALSSRTGT